MISFLSVFPPFRGGIATFSDYLYKELSKTSNVHAIGFSKLYPPFLFPGSSQFEENPVDDYALRSHHSYNPLKWRATAEEIISQKPEALLLSLWHPFFIPGYLSIIKKVKRKNPDIKIVTVAHNIKPHDSFPFSEQLLTSFLEKNDVVITLSSQVEKEFVDTHVSTLHKKLFHPIYTAEPPALSRSELKQKYNYSESEQIVLFFGLIRPYKGLDIFIEALNKIDIKALKLRPLVAGEFYEAKQPYLDLIKEEHRDSYIFMDHFLSNDEVGEVLSISDLLVLPYKSASQSGIFANAVNYHLPVLASNHPGLTEHIEHQKNGLIFTNLDVEDAAKQVLGFFENPEQQLQMRENLAELKQKLSWSVFSSEILKILKE